jgi:hypothetical protein
MQHSEWMALAVAKADGPRTLEELSTNLREWAKSHVGPFELPKLTKAQRRDCLDAAVLDTWSAHGFPGATWSQLFVGESEHLDALIDERFRSSCLALQIALLPIEVREEIEARRSARRAR